MRKVFSIIIILSPLLLAAMSARAQDYSYDGNGNLASDANKQISSIHYNHLNLVDTVVYTDGRQIIYTYSGSGQKLREQAIAANGTTVNKRDYVDHILYLNDTLQEIKHEDGRLVPVDPGNIVSALEYQYHLPDYLGNVRATLTSLPDTDKGTATLESSNLSVEQKRFQRYDDARRISSTLFDRTNGNSVGFSVRLNGSANEKYGLAKSLSVMPGDKIQAEVYAKYPDPNSSSWTGILPVLMGQITSNVAGVVVDGAAYSSSTVSFPAGLAGLQSKTDNGQAPPAYLNWLIFDRDYKFLTGGFVQISTAAKETGSDMEHERLSSPVITITKPGLVYIYLSNEVSGSTQDVFFDDFTVTLDKGPVIAQTDYDPFGLTFNEFVRENAVTNNFLYNGKELQNDFELNWNDFGARMQDPAIGRWGVVDSKAEKYADLSPYTYALNNPLKYVDPDGKDARLVLTENGQAVLTATYYVSDYKSFDRALGAVDVLRDLSGKYAIRNDGDGKDYKLYFSISVIQVKKGADIDQIVAEDPIGNTFTALPGHLYVKGQRVGGNNDKNVFIQVPDEASNLTSAHEIIHGMLGIGGDEEHSEGSVMSTYAEDQTKILSRKTINQIRQTFQLITGKGPIDTPSTAEIIGPSGAVIRTIKYPGSRFETIHEPKISTEEIIKQLFPTVYDPKQ